MICSERMRAYAKTHNHALVGYITAGYPDKEKFPELLGRCVGEGMSVLEIGFPSPDPYADGEVIREAHKKVDPSIAEDMEFWKSVRACTSNPIWIMGYYKDLCTTDIYLELAKAGVADAFVIPDASLEQAIELKKKVNPLGVDVAGFLSEELENDKVDQILSEFGLIYQKLYHGVTGVPSSSESYKQLLAYGLKHGGNHMFAGFGISSGERVEELLKNGFYGAVVGTAIMKALNRSEEEMYALIRELKNGMERAESSTD